MWKRANCFTVKFGGDDRATTFETMPSLRSVIVSKVVYLNLKCVTYVLAQLLPMLLLTTVAPLRVCVNFPHSDTRIDLRVFSYSRRGATVCARMKMNGCCYHYGGMKNIKSTCRDRRPRLSYTDGTLFGKYCFVIRTVGDACPYNNAYLSSPYVHQILFTHQCTLILDKSNQRLYNYIKTVCGLKTEIVL